MAYNIYCIDNAGIRSIEQRDISEILFRNALFCNSLDRLYKRF